MTVNYTASAADLDPSATFDALPDPFSYESLVWGTTQIAKATLELHWLSMEKQKQIALVTSAMNAEVTSGFLSDALEPGVFFKYDSDLQGQIAVIGAMTYLNPFNGMTPPTSFTLSCVRVTTGQREYHPHTYPQLYKAFSDLGTFASEKIALLTSKITEIYMINTGDVNADLDAVYAITW